MTPLSLLYVDDDRDIRTIVQMALMLDSAITVRTASSGVEALRILVDEGWCPDVVVLDVMMPDMNGLEILEALRSYPYLQHITAIFMTAKGRDADLAQYHRAKAKGIILKPFDPIGLAAEIRQIIAR